MKCFLLAPFSYSCGSNCQYISCTYLIKKSKNVKYSNAIAISLLLGVTIYHFNIFYFLIGLGVSLFVAFKAKHKDDSKHIELTT